MSDLTLDYNNQTYANFSHAGLIAAGVPNSVIAEAEAKVRRELIKSECRKRIYGVGSSEAQINVTAMSAAIGVKPAANRTPQEVSLLAAAQASIDWVMAMRARFAELADVDLEADFLADDAWPACPPDVIALYRQF